jgi:hypothetical protein
MGDAALVGRSHGVGERDRESQQLGERHPAGSNAFRQRLPLHQLHRQEEEAVSFLDRVNRDDIRVVEGGDGTRFTFESRPAVGIARRLVRQDLERDLASELRVFGQVDFAHAAGAQRAQDAIVREGLPGRQRTHGCLEILQVGALRRVPVERVDVVRPGVEQLQRPAVRR